MVNGGEGCTKSGGAAGIAPVGPFPVENVPTPDRQFPPAMGIPLEVVSPVVLLPVPELVVVSGSVLFPPPMSTPLSKLGPAGATGLSPA